MKSLLATLSMVVLCVTLTACATREGTGTVLGAGAGAAAGAAIAKNDAVGAVVGGLLGGLIGREIGQYMDQRDQSRLAQTFEYNQTGATSQWTNPDTGYSYAATPTDTFQSSNRPCRRFTLQADIEGTTNDETVTGTACREADGRWQIVS
jgi:surface antigen